MPSNNVTDPQEELNTLLNAAIEMAFNLIGTHGAHIPFAITLRSNGERLNVAADNTEVRDTAILTETVLAELRRMVSASELRAIAFAQNITYRSAVDGLQVDAVEIDLDHCQGRPVTCMVPYRLLKGKIPVRDELFAIEPRTMFFAAQSEGE